MDGENGFTFIYDDGARRDDAPLTDLVRKRAGGAAFRRRDNADGLRGALGYGRATTSGKACGHNYC